MTALWLLIGFVALAAAGWLARPIFRQTGVELNEADSAVSIFRDQADELQRDLKAGLISASEFEAAQKEIEVRALNAARQIGQGLSVSRPAPASAALLAGCAALAAVMIYVSLGTPGARDQPLAARRTAALKERAAAGDLQSRINILIEKTKTDPTSFEDWWMLARSYAAVGDHASAADAYRQAVDLSDDRPAVLAAYAESMTLANGNKVPQAARLVFEQILRKTPDPRARYYLALAKAQAQDFEAAIEDWTALARDSEPGAPWMSLVRRDITNMARFLKRDLVAYLPDATPAEIARAGGSPEDSTELANRAAAIVKALEANPKDYKRWIALAETRSALGNDDEAAAAIAAGRSEFAGAPFVLGKIDEAARALGIDVLEAGKSVRGPNASDVASAASLTDKERNDMIEGMVAGLAARLEENPDDPDGWIMLIRSYSVLGSSEKARNAYETALEQFSGNDAVRARLVANAGSIVGGEQ